MEARFISHCVAKNECGSLYFACHVRLDCIEKFIQLVINCTSIRATNEANGKKEKLKFLAWNSSGTKSPINYLYYNKVFNFIPATLDIVREIQCEVLRLRFSKISCSLLTHQIDI